MEAEWRASRGIRYPLFSAFVIFTNKNTTGDHHQSLRMREPSVLLDTKPEHTS
jgi:hypothetical protein